MSDWTNGYVADIGYTYGYYGDLNPLRVRLAFLNAGLVAPEIGTACELGFGQGVSVNLHAAASVVQWTGTDFNPAHANFAQGLAQVADSGAKLYDEAFEQFAHRADLPDFDYIALHGIWSWISDENRAVIVDFIRRKLRAGGVLYISYNTQPGWAAMVPMRDLLAEHAAVLCADGAGTESRIKSSLAFAEKLLEVNPAYARANPQISERIQTIKKQDSNYVAHEYFNQDWAPMTFAQIARRLVPAKLQWACSANYLDAIDAINLTKEQQALLASIPDTAFRQTARDFCVNQQFRKDYWVKGTRQLDAIEQAEQLRALRVILTQPADEVSLKVNGSLGEATMQETVYRPILDQLKDHKPKSLLQIERALQPAGIGLAQILHAVMVLSGTGALMAAHDEASITKAKKRTDRLNAFLIAKARGSNRLNYLASPVTGGGVGVSRFCQLFMLARQHGYKHANEWAQFTWNLVAAQGLRVTKDGKLLETPEDNLAEIERQAQQFAQKQLPILLGLQLM